MHNNEENNIGQKTKESLAWFTSVPIVLHFIRFANSILLARILDPEDFGIVGITVVLLYFSNSLTEFGFAKAIVQRKDVSQQHYNTYFTFNLGVSVVLYLTFLAMSKHIAIYFHEPDLEIAIDVIVVLFLISAMVAVPMTAQKRDIKFKTLAIAEAIKVSVSIAISLSLALNDYEFLAIVYAMVVSDFVAMLFIRWHSPIKPVISLRFKYLKDLLGFGVWDFLWGQSMNLSENVDKIIIGRMLDVVQLGFFEKAQGLGRMPYEQFSNRLGMVSFSTFSRVQNNPEKLIEYFSKMMIVNAFICFPMYTGLYVVAENFTLVLLGEKWAAMIEPLKVLCLSFLVASISGPIVSVNIASGQIKQQTLIRIVGVIFLIIALIWAVSFGIVAVTYVLLLLNLLLLLASFLLLKKYIDLSVYDMWNYLYPALFSSAILYVTVIFVSLLISDESRGFILIAEILVGGVSYSLAAALIPYPQWKFLRAKVLSKFA